MTMTTMSDLPKGLEEEIIYRVPLKSLRAVRLTCTKWNALSKSRSFIKMHIGREEAAAKELGELSRMIVMMDYNLSLLSVFEDKIEHPSTELRGTLTCLEEQVNIYKVFHCEGFLLCVLNDDARSVVWNPYFGQTRWIEPRYSDKVDGAWDYALGYVNKKNESSRSHKILRFFDYLEFSWYEIYDLDSDLWTTLDVTPHWLIVGDGVSLKGNTYWCARERNSQDEVAHIISFDFTSERFGPLLPMPFSYDEYDNVSLSCVREEKLAVLHQEVLGYDSYNNITIWITTKIEAENLSWSKFLTLDLRQVNSIPNIFIPSSFYVDEEKKVGMAFGVGRDPSNRNELSNKVSIIGEDGHFRELYLGVCAHPKCRPHVCSYVPSVVRIKKPAEGNNKQQNNSEKCRYDQMMLGSVAREKQIQEAGNNVR